MDMKIDALRIKAEREKRAWSQEHLAEAAGLALRTIQRVENSGSGSFETAKALAAVLELDVVALRAAVAGTVPRSHSKVRYVAAAAAVVLGLFAFLTRSAIAGQVALDIGLSMNDEQPSKHHVVVDDGTHAEIRLEGQVRVLVTPTVSADGVMLSIQLYEFADQKFVLAGTPKLLARDNDRAEVRFTSARGNTFRIAITATPGLSAALSGRPRLRGRASAGSCA